MCATSLSGISLCQTYSEAKVEGCEFSGIFQCAFIFVRSARVGPKEGFLFCENGFDNTSFIKTTVIINTEESYYFFIICM